MKQELTLTEDQAKAFESFKDWLSSPDSQYKTLSGFAGTGKTVLLDNFVDYARKHNWKTAVTATTNKAVKVLRDKVEAHHYSTIHSLLNIRAKRKGNQEVFEPVDWDESDITTFALVIIDEASMISSEDKNGNLSLLSLIKRQTEFSDTKVLFCGDPAQLQPIGETVSDVFNFEPSHLNEIVRHDDSIAKVAERLRMETSHIEPDSLVTPPSVVRVSRDDIPDKFRGWRDNPDNIRLVCWRNSTVDYWNRTLRAADYGDSNLPRFCKGDILIANSPCLRIEPDGSEYIMLNNSEEAVVTSAVQGAQAWQIKAKTSGNKKVNLQVLNKAYEKKLQQRLNQMANAKHWKDFWSLKKSFHDVKHSYALTVHKSQGSTFTNVVIDSNDIMMNRDVQNRNQLLYVAITRAAENVFIII